MNITSLSPGQLRQAADLQEQIQGLKQQLNQILGGELPPASAVVGTPAPATEPPRGRKQFSAKTRAKMAAAQKARWAAKLGAKVAKPTTGEAPAAKPKSKKASPALLKGLAKARAARWAKVKAAAKPKAKSRLPF